MHCFHLWKLERKWANKKAEKKGKKIVPIKLLFPKDNIWSSTKLPIPFGMLPVNALYDKEITWSFIHWLKLVGISPLKWFDERLSSLSFGLVLHISMGRLPETLLWKRLMLSKEDMLKIVAGMKPVKLFIGNDIIFRLRRSLIFFGISPANLLLPRYSSSSFDKLQMASGMLPTSLLLNKFNCWSSLHLPKIKWKNI